MLTLLSGIMTLLGSSAFGTIIGGVFAFLNRKTDLEAKKLDLAHEAARWGHEATLRDKDIALAQAEAQAKKDVAIIEADGAFDVARMSAIGQAQANDKITSDEIKAAGNLGWLMVLADVFNRLIRPVATVIVAGAAVYLNWLLVGALVERWPDLTQAQRLEMAMYALSWICGQGSAVLGYWFVSRGSSGKAV